MDKSAEGLVRIGSGKQGWHLVFDGFESRAGFMDKHIAENEADKINSWVASIIKPFREKAEKSPHHENCDTMDLLIKGKPCNCFLVWKEDADRLAELLYKIIEPLKNGDERSIKVSGVVANNYFGLIEEALAVHEVLKGKT